MCTCIRMKAKNGAVVVGRTQEFAAPLGSQVTVLPRGYQGTSRAPSGDGKTWMAAHGAVAVDFEGDVQTLQDGINEQGLYAGLLYMPGFCDYTPADGKDPATLLAPDDMVSFVLGTCANVAEARAAMGTVAVWPCEIPQWGFAPPLHLVLHDASGASAVIEWRDGDTIQFDNPIGVATNAPHLDWHYTNLRNYVNLEPTNPASVTVAGVELAPLGQGSGLRGLPGDTSPPSRFLRATAFTTSYVPVADGPALAKAMLHVMNNFDIPEGSVRSEDGAHIEQTRYTAIANLTDLHYIVRGHDDPTPRRVDLAATDLAPGPPRQVKVSVGDFLDLAI